MNLTSIQQQLSDLRNRQASRFNPSDFAFLESLCERLANPLYSGNEALLNKAYLAIEAYQNELEKSQKRAQKTLAKLDEHFPKERKNAQSLFDNYEYRSLETLYSRLNKARSRLAALKELSQLANRRLENTGAESRSGSLDDLLLQQEEQIFSPVGSSTGTASTQVNENIHGQIELLSVKLFHESMRHSKIDQIIEKAINTWPENPGPHNPHMLAIKAMVRMRTLSPQYLRRLSAYIETLLFLEKNANRVDDSKSLPQP